MKGIIFSGNSPTAIRNRLKTQTRRVIKIQPTLPNYLGQDRNRLYADPRLHLFSNLTAEEAFEKHFCGQWNFIKCPYGVPGDRLYMREEWAIEQWLDEYSPTEALQRGFKGVEKLVWFKDDPYKHGFCHLSCLRGRWRRAIHMPRWASRGDIELTDVGIERVQDISVQDAIAEGLTCWRDPKTERLYYGIKFADVWEQDPRRTYERLWDNLHAKSGHGWDQNDWVWKYSFKWARMS